MLLINDANFTDQMTPNSNYAMFNDLGVYGVPRKVKNKERYEVASRPKKFRYCKPFKYFIAGNYIRRELIYNPNISGMMLLERCEK